MTEKKWISVNAEQLAAVLADNSVRGQTEGLPKEQVWENCVQEDGSVRMELTGQWKSEYKNLVGLFELLIESCSKEAEEVQNKEI